MAGCGSLRDTGRVTRTRWARLEDQSILQEVDRATWTADVSPAPPPPVGTPFFDDRTRPQDVLVAEIDGAVVGYAKIGQAIPLRSHEHVLELKGLAVDPRHQRRGAARQLLEASAEAARDRGARKLSLRVLGPNANARRLYESCGFVVEGVLRDEFFLEGRYVDDVLMARDLTVAE
jgi:ribosomal protein S18 acetylase RimI-like enzyme